MTQQMKSWLIGQILTLIFAFSFWIVYGFLIGVAYFSVVSVLLDIRYKLSDGT